MNATYLAAEGSSSATGYFLVVIPAAVVLWSLAAIHGPELRRRLSAERRHRADLRRVTGR